MKIRNFFLIVLTPIFWGLARSSEQPDLLDVTFSVFPLDGEDWSNIHYAPNGDPASELVELRFNRLERSQKYKFSGPAPLHFYRVTENPDGTQRVQIEGTAPIPAGRPENPIILFCLPPEEDTSRLRILTMPDSEETFPKESIVFFNTMNIPLQGVLGQQVIQIPPGASRPIMVERYFGSQVPIAFAINHNNELHLVLNNKISFFSDRRDILILRKPRRRTSLRIRTQRLTEYLGPRVGEMDPVEEGPEGEGVKSEE